MKRIVLIGFLIVLLSNANGQALPSDKYFFGGRIGLNYSTIGGDADGVDPKAGINVGIFSYTNTGSKLDCGLEIQYSSQGAQSTLNNKLKIKYDYLVMSLIVKYYPIEGINLNIHGGPQLGYMIKGKIDNQDLGNEIIKPDMSVVIGIGQWFFDRKMEISARYIYGLSTTANTFSSSDDWFPNSVAQVGVGFIIFDCAKR